MKMTMKQRVTRYSILVSPLLRGLYGDSPCSAQQATTQSRRRRVLLVSGQANATAHQNTDAARALSRRADIYVGDRITTGNDSQLQLRMKDGAMVALGANAEFVVQAYGDARRRRQERRGRAVAGEGRLAHDLRPDR
jgi:hypothetical protein